MERKERYEVFIVSNVSDVIAQVGLRQKVGQARATEAAAETKTAKKLLEVKASSRRSRETPTLL